MAFVTTLHETKEVECIIRHLDDAHLLVDPEKVPLLIRKVRELQSREPVSYPPSLATFSHFPSFNRGRVSEKPERTRTTMMTKERRSKGRDTGTGGTFRGLINEEEAYGVVP